MEQTIEKITYVLYSRKSSESEDRQVLSIDSQIDELTSLAERGGIVISEVRKEAHSAKAPGRPVFNSILDAVEQGKSRGIIVWNPDRLSRNSVDTGRLIYLFDLGKLQEIITPTQVFRNTPNDKFLLNLLCSQAKLENDNKGINVKRGLKAKAERGIYPAPAPLGYMNERYAERGNKKILKDPERFDAVKKIFQLILTGSYTPLRARKIANEQWGFRTPNGKKLGRSTIYIKLTRPFYYFINEYPVGSGEWHKGIHEPMITEEEYDRIQVLLGRKGKPRSQTHAFAFTGMIRCGECGCMITAEEKTKHQQNGRTHHYVYYRCTKKKDSGCSQRYLEEEKLKAQILKKLEDIEIPPEFDEWAMKWARKVNETEAQERGKILARQQKTYESCVQKIDALIDMRAAGEITEEEFRRKKSELSREKLRLEELLADTGDKVSKWLQKMAELFHFASTARKEFEEGDMDLRRKILNNLGSNLLLKDQKLTLLIQKPVLLIEELSKEVRGPEGRLEPIKIGSNKAEIERSYARNPRLLRD